jgi:hypothetical protein
MGSRTWPRIAQYPSLWILVTGPSFAATLVIARAMPNNRSNDDVEKKGIRRRAGRRLGDIIVGR